MTRHKRNSVSFITWVLFSLYLGVISNPLLAQELVYTTGPQKAYDASHDYFFTLLKDVLPAGQFTVKTKAHLGQGRTIRSMVSSGVYDVIWTGGTVERDQAMHRVPIPLFLGGLGVRGSVVRKDFQDAFSNIKSIDQLKDYIACQGRHWPDADILESAGLTVARITQFDAMLKLLDRGRCDFLPLSIFEGQAELDLVRTQFPTLAYEDRLLLTYPLTMNFYVRKEQTHLAAVLEEGLHKMIESGNYMLYMQSHPLTRNAYPLTRFDGSHTLVIKENTDPTLKKWGLAPFFKSP